MNQKLRCYIKKEGADWVAECIDLSLAAQAESPQLSKEKLESMITTYVDEALNEHKEYAQQLLSRKAPFSQQLTTKRWFFVLSLKCYIEQKVMKVVYFLNPSQIPQSHKITN